MVRLCSQGNNGSDQEVLCEGPAEWEGKLHLAMRERGLLCTISGDSFDLKSDLFKADFMGLQINGIDDDGIIIIIVR